MISELKKSIISHCVNLIEKQISGLRSEIADLSAGAQNENKSTAGDKHETSRAMMHLEQEKLMKRIAELELQLNQMHQIQNAEHGNQKANGVLYECDRVNIMVATGLGKIEIDNISCFVVSRQSPIAIQLSGKKVNDTIVMNKETFTIQNIC
jgi:transcription elongation GreA/GreB family factor